ncbi:crotonase/enoyl-CoA hydratase family protein [Rhodococcus sp. NPDC057014]|uniref:crotonase/enoyl-CoA hydratase family protein n=1 Tax=Rhodococcus sp. NPDC057014 TaxID=3346000 RepID=UPI00363AD893
MSEKVVLDRVGRVLTITLNRPDVRNAIDLDTARGIASAVEQLDSDSGLAVGVITGSNGNFSTGMDLAAFRRGERPYVELRGFGGIAEMPPAKPLIAAVEGYALGGGLEVALAADLIVAADTATFGLPEVRRGLVASGGGVLRLPHRVPRAIAAEWILTGRFVPAPEADRHGLLNAVTRTGEALQVAQELAAQIAENGPLAVRASKRILRDAPHWPAGELFARQAEITDSVRSSADAIEGAAAFSEKRPPRWQGR